VYEEQRRKLMEVFRKRQAELAAKAKQAQQNKGTAAPAAPGNASAQQKQAPATR
jgi:hypothetical protein